VSGETRELKLKINQRLLWDVDLNTVDLSSEAFLRQYIARVLLHGTAEDVRQIGIPLIRKYLTHLALPRSIQWFWEWYSSQPESEACYGHFDAAAKDDPWHYRPFLAEREPGDMETSATYASPACRGFHILVRGGEPHGLWGAAM